MSINQKVFLDVSINKNPPKRITIELFFDTTPKTAQHFLSLCTGKNKTRVSYKNSTFYRVLPGLCQGGDIEEYICNFGEKADNFIRKHDGAGTVSMVTPGGPQFFILTTCSPAYDGGYVVVGRVLDGMSVVNDVQSVGSLAGKTSVPVVIVDCGQIRDHANMGSGLSVFSVAMPSSGEKITTSAMPRRGRGRPPGSGWRQRLARIGKNREELALAASQKTSTPDEVIVCEKLQEHANMSLELSLSSATPSSDEDFTTGGMSCRGRGLAPGTGWRQKLARVAFPQEQEIKLMDHVSMSLESSVVSVPMPYSGEEITTTTFPTMPKNPNVYLDITINNQPTGRIIIELFADTTPQTANYFLSLCTGNNPKRLHYKDSTFHRVLPGLCQGGKIHSPNGTAKAENFIRKHEGPGTVSMVSPRGPQFFILSTSSEIHDGKYVVVGRVVQGLEVVDAVQTAGSSDGKTTMPVVIVDCGQLREELAPAFEDCLTTTIEVIDCDEIQERANMGLESSLVSVPTPSSGEKITTNGIPCMGRSGGRVPGRRWRQNPTRAASQQEQVISTSNGQLSNDLIQIMDVNTQSTAVDAKAVLVLESEKELVEVPVVSEHDRNFTLGLKAGICSLEKHQNELLSNSRTQVSSVNTKKRTIKMPKNEKFKSASQAEHAKKSSLKSGGQVVRKCFQSSASHKMSYKVFEQVISTSNRQLSDSLKEIMNVYKKLIAVGAEDVHILESETESVEEVLDHNRNVLLNLKTLVSSLEKRQTELLSQTRTKISEMKNKSKKLVLEMIPSLSYEDLINIEDMIKKRKIDCR